MYARLQGKDRSQGRDCLRRLETDRERTLWTAGASHPGDLKYRNMGTMENHVRSVIAKRMKHSHCSWSSRRGNRFSDILAKECSGRLYEVTEKFKRPVFEEEKAEEIYGVIPMPAKAQKKNGKGYEHPVTGYMMGLGGIIRGDCKKLLAMVGF